MHRPIAINDKVYWIGINDRETDLFEAHWPLPQGVSYNAYLINDEKVALIDTVKTYFQTDYLDKIRGIIGHDKQIDYLIINHMEPDHSGAIKEIKEIYPDITIIGNKKTMNFLEGFYDIQDKVKIVEDGEELDLGQHKLKFYLTPMVHWPETMMTYDQTDGILFSGDAFGGFGTLDGGIFDDELDVDFYEDEILRYFANIVAKYSRMVQRAIKKLGDLEIEIVASTHGPIWRDRPEKIINDYMNWSSCKTEQGVVVVYGSMYGNTKKMAEEIARELAENGIEKIILHDVSRTHTSFMVRDIWKYKAMILGSCTYNTRLFPPMEDLVSFLENIKIRNHILGIFGSYSWSGGAVKRLQNFADNVKCDLVEPVIETKYAPKDEDSEKCRKLGKNISEKLK
jgi:flavorubredoxin